MSLATVGGQNSTRGELFIPAYGSWTARAYTDNDTKLSGDVAVAIGDLSMSGAISFGDISGSLGEYLIRGALAWDNDIECESYQSDAGSGIRLRTVITDAAQDAGVALSSIDFPEDVRVGSSWARAAGPAWAALDAIRIFGLAPRWYVSPAGRTVFAERPTGEIKADARVKRRALALGIRYLHVDAYAPWAPGLSFEGVAISYVRFRWTREDVIVELGSQ